MESRRLQLIGGGASYGVSLPKQWVETHGLRAGDMVVMEARSGGELNLRSATGRSDARNDRTITVDSNDADEILRRLIALYVAGFDTATIHHQGSDPLSVRTAAGEATARLHGLQIMEDAPGRLVLEDLSDTSDFNLDKGLRRMQSLVLQMLANVGRLAAGGGDLVLRETLRYESELDRLLLLLLKQYAACLRRGEFPPSSITSPVGGLHAMFVAQFMERIGDYAVRMSNYSHFLGKEPAPAVTSNLGASVDELRSLVADSLKAFNTRDVKLADEVIRRAVAFSPTSGKEGLFDTFTSPRSQPQLFSCVRCIKFFSVLESVERIALYAKSIAESAMNWAMAEATAPPPPRP